MKKIQLKKLTIGLLIFVLFSSSLLNNYSVVYADNSALQQQLDDLNKQIKDLDGQKNQLQSQIDSNNYIISGYSDQLSKLYGEAQIYEKQVEELELQIKQMQLQIDSLDSDIKAKEADIQKTENTVSLLDDESNQRIDDSYMSYRLYSATDDSDTVIGLTNINAYFKNSQYKEIIQSDVNQQMIELAELKQELQDKKQELNDKKIQIEKDKEALDTQKVDLSKKKEEADIKASAYQSSLWALQSQNNDTQTKVYALSEDEAKKKADANYIEQQIMNNYSPPDAGQYVAAGTFIGHKGCTGLCTGAHLHFMVYDNGYLQNPCGYLPGGVVDGCGWGNSVRWPLQGDMSITSGYGNRCFWWGSSNYCDFHTGIDIVSQPWNAPVFAANDGYVHKGVDPYGANYVIVCSNPNCNVGIKTGYWHLSDD